MRAAFGSFAAKLAIRGYTRSILTSVTEVDEAYKNQLAQALKAKLGRDVRLHFDTDASLIGGAVIRDGDMVIDGSVKTRLEKLAGALAG